MSLLALMAMAGAVALPERAGSGDHWLRPGDIPKSAFETGEDGVIVFKAVLDPAGKVELCAVEGSTVAQLDRDAFCKRVKQRFAHRPVPGTHSYYVLEENYGFILPSDWKRNRSGVPAHFAMEVSKLPGGAAKPVSVPVNVSVDDKGRLLECSVPADTAEAVLARLACGQLPMIWTPMPETNAAGRQVPYVRQLMVEFREKSAG